MSGHSHHRRNGKNVVDTQRPVHPNHCKVELLINLLAHLHGRVEQKPDRTLGLLLSAMVPRSILARLAS